MLFLISVAYADLPWECPTFTTPADANALRDTDFGARNAYDAIYALTLPYQEGCEWVEVVTSKMDSTLTDRTCTTAVATFVFSEEDAYEPCDGSGSSRTNASELEVSVPTGETWTKLAFRTNLRDSGCSGTSSFGTSSFSVTWEGELEGHGADGELSAERSVDYGAGATFAYSINVDTPTCSAHWSHRDDGFDEKERVAVSGSSVEVDRIAYGEACHDDQQAYVDGVLYGVVSEDTWEYNPDDADRDGSTVPCDCDDADPTRNPYIEDIVNDGVDQDCDGADNLDADDDGHDGQAYGGDDCDDADRSTFPGARERECDGIDQDCDGIDPCDEDTAADTDADTASFTSERPEDEDEETAPPSTREGCAAAAAWLPLLLLGARRRRG